MKKYPYKAWRLMPSFKPVEVEIVNAGYYRRERDSNGKDHMANQLFETKEEAIWAGTQLLSARRVALAKNLHLIEKRELALEKASK
ncbi:MAG: hypothetical protein ACRYF5_15170 [Janthinobacterium lividum]